MPPTVTASGASTGTEGYDSYNLTCSASDSASSIASWSVDWGDGSTPDSGTGTLPSTLSHVFGNGGGEDEITVSATNAAGATGTAIVDVTVANQAPVLQTAAIPAGTVNVGQTYTLPTVTFTDAGLLDWHTASIDWDDGNTDDAQVTEESLDGTTLVPGSLADSHVYAASGDYTGTITLSDSAGATDTKSFTVHVLASTVVLSGFAMDGSSLQVSYSVSGATSAPFTIGIYTSPDGTTADQLLSSYAVGGTDTSELTVGSHSVSIPPPSADVAGDYYLIAAADGAQTASGNPLIFAGGIFQGGGTVYVFGTDAADTVAIGTSSVVLNSGTPFTGTSVTGIHVRTEGGDDAVSVDTGVTPPLALYGGAGNDTITDGGSGGDLLDGGSGQNIFHGGYGWNSPEIVDDSDTAATGKTAYYQESGTGFSDGPTTGFNRTERVLAADSTGVAKWTFTDLDTTAYYDVYVTWSPEAGASASAAYAVYDGTTLLSSGLPAVNQQLAPADDQAAGCFWHHLGVYSTEAGTLEVQLGANSTAPVLADAVRLVKHTTTAGPSTNLVMDTTTLCRRCRWEPCGEVRIVGDNAAPFSIGIYQSPDGVQPTTLVGTIDVSDSADLTGSSGTGTQHTLIYDGGLTGLDGGQYYLAKLDAYNQTFETSKSDNVSALLTGVFQDGGDLYVLAAADSNGHTLTSPRTPRPAT